MRTIITLAILLYGCGVQPGTATDDLPVEVPADMRRPRDLEAAPLWCAIALGDGGRDSLAAGESCGGEAERCAVPQWCNRPSDQYDAACLQQPDGARRCCQTICMNGYTWSNCGSGWTRQ